jgi:hypothetical protein
MTNASSLASQLEALIASEFQVKATLIVDGSAIPLPILSNAITEYEFSPGYEPEYEDDDDFDSEEDSSNFEPPLLELTYKVSVDVMLETRRIQAVTNEDIMIEVLISYCQLDGKSLLHCFVGYPSISGARAGILEDSKEPLSYRIGLFCESAELDQILIPTQH